MNGEKEKSEMNKKILIWGGIGVATAALIIGLIIVLISGGNEDKKEKTTVTTSVESTTESEKDTEETTEEQTTEEQTTENKPSVNAYPTEKNLEYREMLKSQIFEVGYDSYKEAYLHMINLYYSAYRYSEVDCSLVDYDGDDIPELVFDVNSGITMYTYKDSKVYKLIDDRGYGVGGNHGYDFIPGKKIIRNYNTDYAGIIMYETYIEVELNGEKVVNNQKVLKQTFFDDVNNNGVPDDGEDLGGDYVRYYLNDKEITAEKYAEEVVEGAFENLASKEGMYYVTEILEKPELVKVSDAGCREAYLKIIEEFEQWLELEYGDVSTSYALIDFDGDDTLDLVCQIGDCTINFYTYKDGKVYQLMDQWGWGAGGNHGYEYIPGENIYRNEDSNSGDHITSYRTLNDNNELELLYYIRVEWGEYKKDGLNRYYKGTEDGEVEITKDEYYELEKKGNFRIIKGWFTREEIEGCLK